MEKQSIKKFRAMNTISAPKKVGANQTTDMRDMVTKAGLIRTRDGFLKYNTVGFGAAITGLVGYQPRFKTAPMTISAFDTYLGEGTPTYSSTPSANAGADQSKNTGDTVTLDGSASARAVSYLWTQTSGTTVTLSSTTAVSPTFTMPAGDVAFQLKVTNFWGSDTDTVDITEAFAGTLIHNCEELQAMENDLAGNYKLANDIDCTYCTQDPNGALYNGGEGFEPVGTFTGIFDGDGHTITGLFINRPSTSYIGLFESSSGTVKNVGMVNVDIAGLGHVGALIGRNSGTITRSYSTGSVDSASGGAKTGGLVGRNSGTITRSYSTCVVSGSGTAQTIGGLVGYNVNATITNCYSTGSVSGDIHIGGLIGANVNSTVTNCYSTGAVSGSSTGGLNAYNSLGTYNDCFWDTQTSGQATSAGGTGKTTAQMKQEATFNNWNFSTIWDITEGVTYPWLR